MGEKLQTLSGGATARHPATLAWLALRPHARQPTVIDILKERKKAAAYRLHGAAEGRAVVAKRSPPEQHANELDFYTRVLPSLPVATPHYHGAVEDDSGSWLFLEDAGERWYTPSLAAHRRLAGAWLADLHTGPSELGIGLPDRGAAYYQEVLRSTREELRPALCHRALGPSDRRTLSAILEHLDLLEPRWPELETACAVLPEGLVHGDFVSKNVRLVLRARTESIVAFDWGTAGWGLAAPDLSQFATDGARDGLHSYLERAADRRPGLDLDDLVRAANAGVVLRVLKAIQWETRSFAYDWIERAKQKMVVYEEWLAEARNSAGWAA
jgi:hypothetical protein